MFTKRLLRKVIRDISDRLGYHVSGNKIFDCKQWQRLNNGKIGYAVDENPSFYCRRIVRLAEVLNKTYQ